MKPIRLALASVLSLVALACPDLRAKEAPETELRIRDGFVQGAVSESGKTVSYKGIPYARPPVGELRWQPPQPVEPWEGTLQATAFGPRAMQKPIWDDMFFFDPGPSEDCLYLNVWRPVEQEDELAPVMFWIHGGGFIAGGTSEPRQEGSRLAEKGVVVVSIGYRMGVFGFLAHPELTAESPEGASGNYGLLDMVAALEWVRDNIASFGGDPDNVTIFGESAGSMAVSSLMASPLAQGLFHKAIGQSGAAFGRPMPTREEAEQTGLAFAEMHFGDSSLASLRERPAEEILEVAWEKDRRTFRPIVDGYFLPKPAHDIFAAGEQAKTPLLAGWNLDEGGANGFLNGLEPTLANYRQRARESFGDRAKAFLKAYAAKSDGEVERSAADYAGDQFIGYGTWKWIETHRETGDAPVYRYRFDQTLPLPEDAPEGAKERAAHSWDIEYVFRVIESKALPWRPEDHQVSELMASYWTNFARTGEPNGPGLPRWPAYSDGSKRPLLVIDAAPRVEFDTHRARYEFLEALHSDQAE